MKNLRSFNLGKFENGAEADLSEIIGLDSAQSKTIIDRKKALHLIQGGVLFAYQIILFD